MSDHEPNADRIIDLAGAICDETASANDVAELDSIVVADDASRRDYWDFCWIHATLGMEARVHRALRKAREKDGLDTSNLNPWESDALLDTEPHNAPAPTVQTVAFPSSSLQGAFGYFAAGWPVAYLIATVIVAIGLVIGAVTHVSQPIEIVREVRPATESRTLPEPAKEHVGQITDMADCQWEGSGESRQRSAVSGQQLQSTNHFVSLGDTFALKSGLLEITYDTGAKVILQGPVTYEVESPAGGYLSVGKLTAKLEKRSAVSDQRSESANQKSEIRNQKSLLPVPCPLFSVRTPTAVVTDLGTEFGVEVDESGATQSHVFRGSVTVRMLANPLHAAESERVLHENQSTRVECGAGHALVVIPVAESARFVRQMPKPSVTTLDLVDMVAGGDGHSSRRGRGIDPTTGLTNNVQPENVNAQGDYKYHRVAGSPLVDGIFIPDGSKGPVQIDSAGHTFPDCPTTDNCSWAYVWAGGELPPAIGSRMSAKLAGVDYTATEHSLLVIHSNKGITFDLAAVRRSNPGCEVLRFRATAGNVEAESEKGAAVSADIWVLVDGEVRFKRREFNSYNGAAPVAIPIRASDRFLTLAVTDAGNSYMCDQIIFGDPKLELAMPKVPPSDAKQVP
jgi:hypothetical protein